MGKLLLTIGLLGSVFAAQSAPPAAHSFDGVRALIQRQMTERQVPSVAVAVARDGRIVWEEAFGWADRENRVPATAHTLYSLASISKPITATALMILKERGLIDLDRPDQRLPRRREDQRPDRRSRGGHRAEGRQSHRRPAAALPVLLRGRAVPRAVTRRNDSALRQYGDGTGRALPLLEPRLRHPRLRDFAGVGRKAIATSCGPRSSCRWGSRTCRSMSMPRCRSSRRCGTEPTDCPFRSMASTIRADRRSTPARTTWSGSACST